VLSFFTFADKLSSDAQTSPGVLAARSTESKSQPTVQPVSIDIDTVKQTLMKANELYSEVNGHTTDATAATANADRPDDSMRALVRAVYSHPEHYKVALGISNDVYSTYNAWFSFYRQLNDASDADICSMCSVYLETNVHVKQWQQHTEEATDLLHSLEEDISVDDSCEQLCYRIVRKLTKATAMVETVAPSEELTRQLEEFMKGQAMQSVNQVVRICTSIFDDIQQLATLIGDESKHSFTVSEVAALAEFISYWERDASTSESVNIVHNTAFKLVHISEDLLQGLKRDYGTDHKCTQLCNSILEQIKPCLLVSYQFNSDVLHCSYVKCTLLTIQSSTRLHSIACQIDVSVSQTICAAVHMLYEGRTRC
jgi:hypothetical protein